MYFRQLVFLVLAMLSLVAMAQAQPKIVYAEYFIGEDPGFGNGSKIDDPLLDEPLQQSSTIHIKGVVPFDVIEVLQDGFHQLTIRVKDEDENWSIAKTLNFQKGDIIPKDKDPTDIVAYEYFFDDDPGPGKVNEDPDVLGALVSLPSPGKPLTDISLQIPKSIINELSMGFHKLTVRVKNNEGHWSHSISRIFRRHNPEAPTQRPLSRVDYQWLIGGSEVGTPVSLIPLPPDPDSDPPAEVTFKGFLKLNDDQLTNGVTAELRAIPYDDLDRPGSPVFRKVVINWKDTDKDGFPDKWEEDNGYDKLVADDKDKDSDQDGLKDEEEFKQGTDPKKKDTDGDGIEDKKEIALKDLGFDPNKDDKEKLDTIKEAAKGAGIYKEDEVKNINVQVKEIKKDPKSGEVKVTVKVEESSSLIKKDYQKVEIKKEDISVKDGEITIKIPDKDGNTFVFIVKTDDELKE